MTPKEKAKELVTKFVVDLYIERNLEIHTEDAILCALIAVNEIMYNNIMEHPQNNTNYVPHKNDYWQQVRQEIINL